MQEPVYLSVHVNYNQLVLKMRYYTLEIPLFVTSYSGNKATKKKLAICMQLYENITTLGISA